MLERERDENQQEFDRLKKEKAFDHLSESAWILINGGKWIASADNEEDIVKLAGDAGGLTIRPNKPLDTLDVFSVRGPRKSK